VSAPCWHVSKPPIKVEAGRLKSRVAVCATRLSYSSKRWVVRCVSESHEPLVLTLERDPIPGFLFIRVVWCATPPGILCDTGPSVSARARCTGLPATSTVCFASCMEETADADPLLTLDQALAFIFEGQEAPSLLSTFDGLLPLDEIDVCEELPTHSGEKTRAHASVKQAARGPPPPPKKKKKRMRNASCSSTALQRRAKAEIQTLREHAAELEGYLEQLKRTGGCRALASADPVALGGDPSSSQWHHYAVMVYRAQSKRTYDLRRS
jgi:hypothetical protein